MNEEPITELSSLAYLNDGLAEQADARGNREIAAYHKGRALAFRSAIRILKGAS
jgi:hypothetical protein